ncbi:MAG TPA: CBS domain-containing protein [Phycisphaerales bacterium]|nr:CBS domain-containing protein [Phycisphaerales bacterium]
MGLKVSDIMTRTVVTVDMDETVQRVKSIFDDSKFHHLVVTENARVAGIISDRDLLKNLSPFIGNEYLERKQDSNTLNRKAHQIMTRHPVLVKEEMDVVEATELLLRKGVSCLPVVGKELHIVGIITWRDLLKVCYMCQGPAADRHAA